MIKKIMIIMMLLLTFIVSGFSATIILTDCNTIPSSSNTYELSPSFSKSSNNCVDFRNLNDVIFDGKGMSTSNVYASIVGGSTNIIYKNIIANEFMIAGAGSSTGGTHTAGDITFINNTLLDQQSFLFDVNTNKEAYGTTGSVTFNLNGAVTVQDNYIKFGWKYAVMGSRIGMGGNVASAFNLAGLFTVTSNDFIGGQYFLVGNSNAGVFNTGRYINLGDYDFSNNNFGSYSEGAINIKTCTPTSQTWVNNYIGNVGTNIDSDFNGYWDNPTLISSGGCTFSNLNEVTKSAIINTDKAVNTNEYVTSTNGGSSSYFGDNKHYYLTTPLTLDSANVLNLQGSQFVTFDLSLFKTYTAPVLSLEGAPNLIRLGNNNNLIGDITNKPIVRTTATINAPYTTPSSNWALINYQGNNLIQGIDFEQLATGNYGLIKNFQSDVGDFLTFDNNIVEVNYIKTTITTPEIKLASRATITNNYFDIDGGTENIFVGGNEGGHFIQDNTFKGAGFVFHNLNTLSSTYVSLANHNEFILGSFSTESQPFDITDGSYLSTQSTLILNGDYVYDTGCDRYTFDIGNYYYDNSTACTDADLDGVCDEDYAKAISGLANITDFQTLVTYPYNFASHTGLLVPTDLCGTFTFNIISPVDDTNYTLNPSETFLVDFEFISSAYPTMDCDIYLNDNFQTELGVTSGQNIQYEYDLNDGEYNFKVICENGEITKESDIIYFVINNGIGFPPTPDPVTPTVVYGCTDVSANNYNILADTDDGSCTYDNGGGTDLGGIDTDGDFGLTGIFSTDIDNSADTLTSTFALVETPLGYGIMFGMIAIFMGLLSLLFAFMRGMIK